MFVVGGVHVSVAEPVATACTVKLNAASDALASPSLTLMTMPLVVPTCCAAGVPDSRPVAVSNDAQAGGFAMLNVNGSPSASLAVGVKTYCVPGDNRSRRRAADRRRSIRRSADDDRERRELRACPARR